MDMQLELTSDQKVLIDDKNKLSESVLGKYRLAGQIAQTGLVFVTEFLKSDILESHSVGEICRLADRFLQRAVAGNYKKVEERGIALPVQICKNEFVASVAPEQEDAFQGGYIKPGDIVKVSLGVHIDGYTAQVSHTVVIRDDELDQTTEPQPLVGDHADAVCASYIATEAVITLLSIALTPDIPVGAAQGGVINGTKIRALVEKIAAVFRVQIAPGSRVRRVRRFLAGQNEDVITENDFKGVQWDEESLKKTQLSKIEGYITESEQNQLSTHSQDDFKVSPGEAWLVDISMAATGGENGVLRRKEFEGFDDSSTSIPATIFTRDYSITYGLKLNASRQLLTTSAAVTSVFPFKLSHVVGEGEGKTDVTFAQARLGLSEIVQHHIFVPHSVQVLEHIPLDLWVKEKQPSAKEMRKAAQPVSVAREMSTVVIVPGLESQSGFPELVRLTGGNKTASPSWVHSNYQITDETILQLINLRNDEAMHGIKFQEVQPAKYDRQAALSSEAQMEVDQ